MSKYLLSAGVVWVFLCFVVGVIILMMPESKPELQTAPYRAEVKDSVDMQVGKSTSNKAKTSVEVDGTPFSPTNAVNASVQVKE